MCGLLLIEPNRTDNHSLIAFEFFSVIFVGIGFPNSKLTLIIVIE